MALLSSVRGDVLPGKTISQASQTQYPSPKRNKEGKANTLNSSQHKITLNIRILSEIKIFLIDFVPVGYKNPLYQQLYFDGITKSYYFFLH
jgi:hypothetical protein